MTAAASHESAPGADVVDRVVDGVRIRHQRRDEGVFRQGSRLPLVLAAEGRRGARYAARWLEEHGDLVADRLSDVGAIVLRGFDLEGAADFEQVALAIDPDLRDRLPLDDGIRTFRSRFTYDGADYSQRLSAFHHLPLHFEDYYMPACPTKIMFFCAKPAPSGGETAIVDGRAIYADIPEPIRRALEGRRYVNSRVIPEEVLRRNSGLESREEIEAVARAHGVGSITWHEGDGGARAHIASELTLVIAHARTGDPVWFNALAQQQRPSHLLGAALACSRIRDPRLVATNLFGLAVVELPSVTSLLRADPTDPGYLSRRWTFEITRRYWRNAVAMHWRAKDVLVLDNHAVAHGRLPHLGSRALLACTSRPKTPRALPC